MASIFEKTYGRENRSDLVSGVVVAKEGMRFIDVADIVGPTYTNRPLENLLKNDQEINYHLKEVTTLMADGVFPDFEDAFELTRSGDITGNNIAFTMKGGLGKIDDNVLRIVYKPDVSYTWDHNPDTQQLFQTEVPAQVTGLNIDVTVIGTNEYRRDLVVLTDTGEVTVVQGTASVLFPSQYSQIDAPANSIALYAILFRKISGVMQTPTIEAVYDSVGIEGIALIERFADLFGDGIFRGEPASISDPLKVDFTPELTGGDAYMANAGSALIDGALLRYGAAGNTIALAQAATTIGAGSTPGSIQGNNSNNWESVDFTSTTTVGAAGTGTGNTQYLKFDNTGNIAYVKPGMVKIFTAATAGEGGYITERTYDTDIISAPGTEDYSIDLTNGTIKREKTTAPLRIYVQYTFARNRRYLPYLNKDGSLGALQSTDYYPTYPPEFASTSLSTNTIGLKSITYNAIDTALQSDSYGTDFRVFMDFQLDGGQLTTSSIKDDAITGDKIASDAINNADQIADGVLVQNHLSDTLQDSLSNSRMYARGSLTFSDPSYETIFTFLDKTDGTGNIFTKQLTDLSDVSLISTDAEVQSPVSRAVVADEIFDSYTTSEVTTNPEAATNTFTVTLNSIGSIVPVDNIVEIDYIAISFADFGFSQAGNVIVLIVDPDTGITVGQSSESILTVKNAVTGLTDAFYKMALSSTITLTIDKQYQIRVAKTLASDTLFIHTASAGSGRSSDISFRLYYKPPAGKYGLINSKVQGYRIYDDFGDLTVEYSDRLNYNLPTSYIPYAASIPDPSSFVVFTDPSRSNGTNYIAVDVTRGVFKFTAESEPATVKLTADFNIIQSLNQISSARIHRHTGKTIEHTLRILETELGSIQAHVKNNLELLYSLGNGKFKFSSEDRALTNMAGDILLLSDGNLVDPIHVIDRVYEVPEGKETTREIQDSFNNTDVIEFTPRAANVAIFALYLDVAGTNYTAIQLDLHAGAHTTDSHTDPPLKTATLSKASVNLGLNFFTLESDLTIDSPYHVYVRILGFTGALSIRPSLKVDVENGNIEFYHYFLPTSGKYGTTNGYSIYDSYGDLNLGSEARGSDPDFTQENFLDSDGWQVQSYFDDNDLDPANANTTFPIFTPSKPSTTGMVRFDIYFKSVPAEGEDGYNGVYRLLLHDADNSPVIPANITLAGQSYIDVKIPKTAGWQEVKFIASLRFGQSYHIHMWGNGADLALYVGTHAVSQEKSFKYIAGDRFIIYSADLSGDKFDSYKIVAEKLAAVDLTTGRIKFHPDDITSRNSYYANFNLFTKTADVQSDTIVRPNGETIENALINIQPIVGSEPTRQGIDQYTFNPRSIELVDELGRSLAMYDGELPYPYPRIAISDTDVTGAASALTAEESDNIYTFFVDYHSNVVVERIKLHFNTVTKDSYNTILNIYEVGSSISLGQAYIRSKDLATGFNDITLENISGEPLNLTISPNTQYRMKYTIETAGVGTAPKLSQNVNNLLTTTVYIKPTTGGQYGTANGTTIKDSYGDISKFFYERDEKDIPSTVMNTDSGLINLKVAGDETSGRGMIVWEENKKIRGSRFNLTTGEMTDTVKLSIAGSSGSPAISPDIAISDDVAYTVWVESGVVYGRRLFLDNTDPMSIDSESVILSDSGASGVANPTVGAGRDRLFVAWEDARHAVSGTVSDPALKNIFGWSFDNATDNSAQFDPTANTNSVFRLNSTTVENAMAQYPEVSVWKDDIVIVYQSDINNQGISNDVMISVFDADTQSLVRSDIKIDKAPVVEGTTQTDAKLPKIASYKNRHLVAWMDNRDGTYRVFGKVYDSNELTFEQSDIQLEMETVSGVIDFNIHTDEKLVAVGYTDGIIGTVKRLDFASMKPHDTFFGWDMDFDSVLNINIDSVYPYVYNKTINSFGISINNNIINRSRLIGVNTEPVAVDLTDFSVAVNDGYIGIDVINGRFKFADGAEILEITMDLKVDYNLKIRNIKDITPETITDIDGKLQSDHNTSNTIARNDLVKVKTDVRNNQAKLSEVEKLSIKQQTEIDFIKNTPTKFDLAETELFTDEYGTLRNYVINGNPNSDILLDTFAPREDGNFEYGLLKNPRMKYRGGITNIATLAPLFGSTVRDIHYSKKTGSLWIVTSDADGRGYLYRCEQDFVDGMIQIIGYWVIDTPATDKQYISVAESYYDGKITLFVGVSDEGVSGDGHYLNRYRIKYNKATDTVTIADGKEIETGVPHYKNVGDILASTVTANLDLGIQKVDIQEEGKLRGMDIVNDNIYLVFQNDESVTAESDIDKNGYSLIRRIKLTEYGANSSISYKFKLDDIFEDALNTDRYESSPTTEPIWDAYGIAIMPVGDGDFIENLTQEEIDSQIDANTDATLVCVSVQHRVTFAKKIVLMDLAYTDVTSTDPNYNTGLFNLTSVKYAIEGHSSNATTPYIAMSSEGNIIEVSENATYGTRLLAIHDSTGFDIFQGNVKYTAKTKRYFDIEHFHAQLGVQVSSVCANRSVAITAGPDNTFSFTAGGYSKTRNTMVGTMTGDSSIGGLFHVHSYHNGEPLWSKPDLTFWVNTGGDAISGIISTTIIGDVSTGESMYITHWSTEEEIALGFIDLTNSVPTGLTAEVGTEEIGTHYQSIEITNATPLAGNMGEFAGPVSYDPIAGKLWVATTYGFIDQVNITPADDAGELDYTDGKSFKVLKLNGDDLSASGAIGISGVAFCGSQISALSVYDNKAYVAQYAPNAYYVEPKNTIIRVFDMVRSTSSFPMATDIFTVEGIVRDINVSDAGMYVTTVTTGDDLSSDTTYRSQIKSIYTKQFNEDVFESTEVIDEFNFLNNPALIGLGEGSFSGNVSLGYSITSSLYMERGIPADEYQEKGWVLPRRAIALGLKSTSALSLDKGKLQIIDYSNIDNPLLWTEFIIPTGDKVSEGMLLPGSGSISAMTFIDEKLWVGRKDSVYGTSINIIDFAKNTAHIMVDSATGYGRRFSGMQYGFKEEQTDKTGTLHERNNSSFHYSGFVNPNIKIGDGVINDMDSAYLINKIDDSVVTPYVIVGRTPEEFTSGGVDIINGITYESVIDIGRSRGSVKKVCLNPDGSAIVAINREPFLGLSETSFWKINDIRLVSNDGEDYQAHFLAQEVKATFPGGGEYMGDLTDMKVQHYTTTLGETNNIIYASFSSGVITPHSPAYAVKFNYETVSNAGGDMDEWLNNVETIYYSTTINDDRVTAIDYMDDRIFLGFTNPANDFKMAVLKKFPVLPGTDVVGFSNNWYPILGDNGMIPKYMDYNDLNYNGIRSNITSINAIESCSLVFANTVRGSVLFKFPFVTTSHWHSKHKNIDHDVNAVALARDVYVEDGFLTELVERNDERLKFTGDWKDVSPGDDAPYTTPLFNKASGKRQMGAKLLQESGYAYATDTYYKYKPFTVAEENNLTLSWDGTDIANYGYDYKDNVMMIEKDEPFPVMDLFNTTTASYTPIYKDKKLATISLNEASSVIQFFQTASGTMSNEGITNQYNTFDLPLDISQVPVITIYAEGKQLATFENIDGTINETIANSQKLLTIEKADGTSVPVDRIIMKGKNNKSVKKLRLVTWNQKVREKLYPELEGVEI